MSEVNVNDAPGIAAVISQLISIGGILDKFRSGGEKLSEYQDAVSKYDKALRETVNYMERVKRHEEVSSEKENQIANLWSDASIAINKFDPNLANRCFIKAQGWLDHNVWDDPRYQKYKISLDDMREALMELNEKSSLGLNNLQSAAVTKRKIFLASSSELEQDRRDFEVFISRKNTDWINHGVFLQLVVWENFLDFMSNTRLQDEYNKEICRSDVFVMLFWKKVGAFTEEEFETAFGQFKVTNRPFIFTYFKNAPVNVGDVKPEEITTLWNFQKKLRDLGHFQTKYTNTDELQLHFNQQLEKLSANRFRQL
jgi:hypothetical protein